MNREWDANEALRKWLAKNSEMLRSNGRQCVEPIRIYERDDIIPIAELELAVVKSARIVQQLGLPYIGIFERAERELFAARDKLQTMERISHIAYRSFHLEGNLIEP